MPDANAARRWSKALLDLATEAGSQEAVLTQIEEVVETLRGHGGELFSALSSPVFSVEERAKVIDTVLERLSIGGLTHHFLRLVNERARLSLLPEIVAGYRAMLDDDAGRVYVHVTTTEPLSPQLEGELKAVFEKSTGKQVRLDAHIDPSLIGGLVARVGGTVYDASIRSRLEDLKHRLIYAQALPEA